MSTSYQKCFYYDLGYINIHTLIHTHTQALSIPDNDKLSAQVATAIDADLLILLSDVDGLYTGPPSEHGSRLIKTYHPEHVGQIKFWSKSRVGRGGMESKV